MATTDQRKTVPYPNLDTWTFTLESKVASILLDYFTSNYDQSNMFMGKIRSFVYTAAQYNHDPMGCANAVQDDLTNLFGYYFEESQVTVNHKDAEEDNGKYDLYINIEVKDTRERITQSRIIQIDGTRLARMLKYNNEGVLIHEWKTNI